MRWLTTVIRGGGAISYRKLQYRIAKNFLHRALEGWTEWQDIPEVQEERVAAEQNQSQQEGK